MLYGIGIVILLLSCAVESESLIVPVIVALVGIVLMSIGKKPGGRHETE